MNATVKKHEFSLLTVEHQIHFFDENEGHASRRRPCPRKNVLQQNDLVLLLFFGVLSLLWPAPGSLLGLGRFPV